MPLKKLLHKNISGFLLVCSFIFFETGLITNNVFAQENKAEAKTKIKKYDWGNLGFGYSDQNFYSDITGTNYGFDYNILLSKIFFQTGLSGYLKVSDYSPMITSIYAGAGYGVGYYNKFMIALSLCPSYQTGFYLTQNDSSKQYFSYDYRQPGITANLQLIGKPAEDFGFGLIAYGMFNKYVSNVGLRFVLHISSKKPQRQWK